MGCLPYQILIANWYVRLPRICTYQNPKEMSFKIIAGDSSFQNFWILPIIYIIYYIYIYMYNLQIKCHPKFPSTKHGRIGRIFTTMFFPQKIPHVTFFNFSYCCWPQSVNPQPPGRTEPSHESTDLEWLWMEGHAGDQPGGPPLRKPWKCWFFNGQNHVSGNILIEYISIVILIAAF